RENLEMLRGVGDRESCRACESVYRTFALQEEIEQLKPRGSCERLGDPRELLVDALLGSVGWYVIGHSIPSLNTSKPSMPSSRSEGAPWRLSCSPISRSSRTGSRAGYPIRSRDPRPHDLR